VHATRDLLTSIPVANVKKGDNEVADRIIERRGVMGLLECDLAMLHSPPMANGWNELLKAVRGSSLPASIRELAVSTKCPTVCTKPGETDATLNQILRTTSLLNASYEYAPHVGIGLKAGLSEEEVKSTEQSKLLPTEEIQCVFSDNKLAVVYEVAQAMTIDGTVSSELYKRLSDLFDHEQTVELITTIAAYNFTSRIVNTFGLQHGAKNQTELYLK
jgi:4-carboxymuconolactone decarboxylase